MEHTAHHSTRDSSTSPISGIKASNLDGSSLHNDINKRHNEDFVYLNTLAARDVASSHWQWSNKDPRKPRPKPRVNASPRNFDDTDDTDYTDDSDSSKFIIDIEDDMSDGFDDFDTIVGNDVNDNDDAYHATDAFDEFVAVDEFDDGFDLDALNDIDNQVNSVGDVIDDESFDDVDDTVDAADAVDTIDNDIDAVNNVDDDELLDDVDDTVSAVDAIDDAVEDAVDDAVEDAVEDTVNAVNTDSELTTSGEEDNISEGHSTKDGGTDLTEDELIAMIDEYLGQNDGTNEVLEQDDSTTAINNNDLDEFLGHGGDYFNNSTNQNSTNQSSSIHNSSIGASSKSETDTSDKNTPALDQETAIVMLNGVLQQMIDAGLYDGPLVGTLLLVDDNKDAADTDDTAAKKHQPVDTIQLPDMKPFTAAVAGTESEEDLPECDDEEERATLSANNRTVTKETHVKKCHRIVKLGEMSGLAPPTTNSVHPEDESMLFESSASSVRMGGFLAMGTTVAASVKLVIGYLF